MNLSRRILVLITISCAGFAGFYPSPVQAQEKPKGIDTIKVVKLSPARLKAFEGVYQFSKIKELYVQFRVVKNSLIAKLLWTNREIPTIPNSDSSFLDKEPDGGARMAFVFTRDRQGAFTKVSVGNTGLWVFIKDYKPVVKKEIEHTPGQLKPFEGLFGMEGNSGVFLQLTEKENKLVLHQYWDGHDIIFMPDSAMRFFCKEQSIFTLEFIKDSSGDITQMIAFSRDKWIKAAPAHFNAQELKAFEGKYRFKEDPDNLIRITAKDSGLVVKQLWDGKEIILEPLAESFFYCPAQSYSLNFTRDKDGAITEVRALNNDVFEKVVE